MKDLLHQTDHRLAPDIQNYGCLFRSLTAIAEYVAMRALTANQLADLWNRAKTSGAIGYRQGKIGPYIEKPDAILALAWAALGLPDPPMRQVGSVAVHESAKPQAWGAKVGRFCILKGATAKGNSHFRLGGPTGNEIFDPRPQTPLSHEERIDFYA